MEIQITDEPDVFGWNLTTSGFFTVRSLYQYFMRDHADFSKNFIRKIKVPLKTKIFIWFLCQVILTKDNLPRPIKIQHVEPHEAK